MNGSIKKGLQATGLYHPLQSFYRGSLFHFKNFFLRLRYRGLAGAGITCNVCGATYKEFAPYQPNPADREALEKNNVIAGYGDNVFCPNCMSTARERMVLAYLKDYADVEGKATLHLSPEKHIYAFLKTRSIVTTADLIPGFYKSIDRGIKKEDATALSFADESFDLVVANHIMEHIPDDRSAMHELYRVLKAGSQAIMQVPYSTSLATTIEDPDINDPDQQSALYGQKDHVRIYAFRDYINRLTAVGFRVRILNMANSKEYIKSGFQNGELFLEITKTTF